MLTPFGKEVRKVRIDKDMKLSEMADVLDVSPTFLTAVETGRKAIPENLPERISQALKLSKETTQLLRDALELSRAVHKVVVGRGSSDRDREVAALFARQFPDLTETKKDQIMQILKKQEDEE